MDEAKECCTRSYVPASPVQRLRLKLPTSTVDAEQKWSRVKHRMEHLVLQACPDGVREELSAARISGLLHVLCRLHIIYKPGGLPEKTEALRQVQSPKAADSAVNEVLKLRTWRRWLTRLGDLGGSRPDPAAQIQAPELITSGVLRSLSIVNFRINLVRAALHLDTQPTNERAEEFYEHVLAELESVSRATDSNKEGKDRGGQVRQVDAKVQGSEGSPAKPSQPKVPTPAAGSSSSDAGKRGAHREPSLQVTNVCPSQFSHELKGLLLAKLRAPAAQTRLELPQTGGAPAAIHFSYTSDRCIPVVPLRTPMGGSFGSPGLRRSLTGTTDHPALQ